MVNRKRTVEVTGYLIQSEVKARGGVTHRKIGVEHKDRDGNRETRLRTVETTVDDTELYNLSMSIVSRAKHLLERHCTSTPIGWFCDDAGSLALDRDFQEVRDAAQEFNELAETSGSERRVEAEIYPVDFSFDNERMAQRVARTVRETLAAARDAFHEFRDDEFTSFDTARDKCRNLHRLAVGIQAESVKMAVEHLNGAKKACRDLVKDTNGLIGEVVAGYSMEPVDAAINLFQPIGLDDVEAEPPVAEVA